MESRHHDRFDLRKHAREIVLLLLRDTNHEVSLHDISKSLKLDAVLVKMERARQIDMGDIVTALDHFGQHYP